MSQKKRLMERKRREAALKKAEADRKRAVIVGIIIGVVLIGIIAGAIIFDYQKKSETELNYSIGLARDGRVKGADTAKCVELCDFNQIDMNPESYYPTAEEEEQYIQAIVSSYPSLSDKEGVTVNEGDLIDIDYICYIEGEKYADGSTNGNGVKMNLGSAGYPEGFEAAIIGKKTGETVNVSIPYTTDFANEDLAGQIADYEITINGVYENAEFNDEFVQANFPGMIADADEFLQRYRTTFAQAKFDERIKEYMITDSKVNKIPASYLSSMKKYMKAKDLKQLETTNSTYNNLYGYNAFDDVYEMRNLDKNQYAEEIKKSAESEAKRTLIYQAVFDKNDLEVTDEDINDVLASYSFGEDEYDQAVKRFGEPYIYQQAMQKAVDAFLTETYNLPE